MLKKATAVIGLCLCACFSSAADTVIGKWIDDVGSPDFLDAQLTILKDGKKYYLDRRNGDGSSGMFRLEKQRGKNRYTKIEDGFGAEYEVTTEGLNIYDTQGFVRQAKSQM